ncbi:hypothetical protein [Periweissella fabalis]|uniref:Uncharacterized protein n=1 Tax=Periweissella fabalis TaxID=1070421 RepID=A0A7X6N583_9LACO|nr:hypothetical protein [Periweissella fabalis]MCM0598498.1 hypothetical protein [Periweissella fabalis]NKZ24220.1 hypothetical protein [Periweissella fabalis]
MKLICYLKSNGRKPGFALGILGIVLFILASVQLWQVYNYQKQIQLYKEISLAYKMKIAENEIKIQILSGSQQREFSIKKMDIKVVNETIIFNINKADRIEHKFILPQRIEP